MLDASREAVEFGASCDVAIFPEAIGQYGPKER
jgi:hypothetical protein